MCTMPCTGDHNFKNKQSLKSITFGSLLFIIALLLLSSQVFAGITGTVPGFGDNGAVIYRFASFNASAVQADGKLLVTGSSTGGLTTLRYNTDGSLDSSFNKTGVVMTEFPNEGYGRYNSGSSALSIAVQKDGKILVAGFNNREAGIYYYLVIVRYNPDGSLDNSFDGDGKISPSNGIFGFADYIALQSDQKIVVAGNSGILLRFNIDGSRDLTFDQSYEFGLSLISTHIASIAVQPDNKILVLRADSNLIVVRYNPNGTRDSSFNRNGVVVTDFGGIENASAIAIQTDGKFVITGDTRATVSSQQRRSILARYNPDGSLDQSFNGNGKVIADYDPNATYPNFAGFQNGSVVIQTDGKIVTTRGGLITRYNLNGSLDQSFYSAGKKYLEPGVTINSTVIIDNNLYLVGNSSNGGYLYAITLDSTVSPGLNYRYYEGEWNTLPDFNTLTPLKTGMIANVDLSVRPSGTNDHFAFVWEGFINIQTPGNYTFETVSDDGSKFYFNTFYSSTAQPLVNNDGVHPSKSATGSVNIPSAGLYPITITYFEKDGDQTMQLYWTRPGSDRQLVPDAAFIPSTIDYIAPTPPVNPHVVYKGRRFARLDWENSTDNTGVTSYEVIINNGIFQYTTTQSFLTANFLSPNTTYTFNVNAVDAAGNKSDYYNPVTFTTPGTGLDYKIYANVTYGQRSLESLPVYQSGVSNNVDISVRPKELNENYAFLWKGYINIPAPGTYTFETVSDDGSRLYLNTPYSDIAAPFLDNFDNNGLHAPQSVSRSINIPSAGLYPIAIAYHQYGGGQLMQLYWQGPGFSRQPVPDAAFTDDSIPGFLVNGLNYKYYEGTWETLPDFSTLTPVKTGLSSNVDLNVRTAGRNDNFAFVWEGYITVQDAGDYTFETISDDGSKFYFNSKYIPSAIATVNNDGLHPATSAKATVHIGVAGTYPISISFFENTGDEKMEVYWTGPNITRQLIPSEVLSPNPSLQMERLSYKYYQNVWTALPDFSTLSPNITGTSQNVDITARPSQWNDIFAFMWQGYINIPAPGNYTFETVSDDGSKLYFNMFYSPGAVATVNNDGVHAPKSATGTVNIANAGVYPIAITYFEQYYGETMEVYWTGPGIPRQRIPNDAFTLLDPAALPTTLAFNNTIANNSPTINLIAGKETDGLKSVYPNPFNETVTIDFYNSLSTNDIIIGMYDLNGREVFRKHAGRLPVGNNSIKMNLSSINIKDGVYIVQLQKNGMVWKTEKIIKMKK